MLFHFPDPDNLKNGDNSKSPKNELLAFAMQQEHRREINKTKKGLRKSLVKDITMLPKKKINRKQEYGRG